MDWLNSVLRRIGNISAIYGRVVIWIENVVFKNMVELEMNIFYTYGNVGFKVCCNVDPRLLVRL